MRFVRSSMYVLHIYRTISISFPAENSEFFGPAPQYSTSSTVHVKFITHIHLHIHTHYGDTHPTRSYQW